MSLEDQSSVSESLESRQQQPDLDADISESSSADEAQQQLQFARIGRKRARASNSSESVLSKQPRLSASRGGVSGHWKGKGSTAYGRAHFRKGQGLTAQGRAQALTQAQTHSKEGSAVSLQSGSEAITTSSRESEGDFGANPSNRRRVRQESLTFTGRPAKRPRTDTDSVADPVEASGLPCFEPSSLIKSREGTFQVPPDMRKYLNRHLRRCLSKEEREALFKEHPRPNLESCTAPRVDKYISDFLGKRLPKEKDAELSKIQTAILAIIRPLTSAWQQLVEAGLEDDPIVVPGTEVLTVIQQAICLVGNASELTSQIRRSQILTMIDTSWSKFSSESAVSATDTLFGDEFQESLGKKVEKETALAKAVSITRRNKPSIDAPSTSSTFTRKDRPRNNQFFRRGPPTKYGGGQGRSVHPYRPHHYPAKQTDRRGTQTFRSQKQTQRPLFHEPSLPSDPKAQQKKSWTS